MQTPGGISHHHRPAVSAPASNASKMMPPHEVLLGSPSPSSASVVSARIDSATVSTVLAKITGITLGRMCRLTRCQLLAPRARARSTYGRSFTDRVSARTNRAVPAHDVTPITRIVLKSDFPRMDARTIARGIHGITRNQFVSAFMKLSVFPP
jgi:hypothetical protein